ncbi:MAG: amidohydrolase family protein, partial [bacterium]
MLFSHCDILTPAGVLKNAYLSVEGDTIAYIGAEKPPFSGAEKDMRGKLLLPGLVNTHTHAAMTLLRGVGSDLALHDWLFHSVFPVEDRLTPETVRVGSELAILELLASGVTSFSDMYFFPDETAKVVLESGIKANLNRPVQAFDPAESPAESTRLREAIAFYDRWNGAGAGRLKVDFCVHAEYTCNEAVTRATGEEARKRGANIHIHLSETKSEQDACLAKYGKTPARWFSDLGVFDARAFCAHCVWVTEEDLELMREKKAAVVHNPTSNMKLGSGFAPVQKMLDMGI